MIRHAAVVTLALALPAGAFDFGFPVACTLGVDCHVQNYFDRDPGAGTADIGCGNLTYDGHDGTDFALPTLAAMAGPGGGARHGARHPRRDARYRHIRPRCPAA